MWIEIAGAIVTGAQAETSSPTRGMWIEIVLHYGVIVWREVIPHTGDVD